MSFFLAPGIEGLIQKVKEQFALLGKQPCDYLFLVGGFAESKALQKAVKENFAAESGGPTRVVIPEDPNRAILGGAVAYALNPDLAAGPLRVRMPIEQSVTRCPQKALGESPMKEPAQDVHTLSAKVREMIEAVRKRQLVILLTGRTGQGKSSTINSLLNSQVARVGDDAPVTDKVEGYEADMHGIKVLVVDTPGLCDQLPEKGNDERYLGMMKKYFRELGKPVDSLWFVTRLIETRVGADEQRGINLISMAFGAEGWQRAVIVFTWANTWDPADYSRKLQTRTSQIRAEIAKHVPADLAEQIPAVAVENNSATTSDGETWLNKLYVAVMQRCSSDGVAGFYIATHDLITPRNGGTPYISLSEEEKKVVQGAVQRSSIGGVIGFVGGTVVAVAAGAASLAAVAVVATAGAVVGAVAGALSWLLGKK
jgi:GTP-binding protein EngB required for normal cell division